VRPLALAALLLAGCGGGDDDAPLPDLPDAGEPPGRFDEPAECGGTPMTPATGSPSLVVSRIEILTLEEGAELDGDGVPDNQLAALSSLAGPALADAIADGSLILLAELFDAGPAPDGCVKLAVYDGGCLDAVCTVGDGVLDVYGIQPSSLDAAGAPISRFLAGSVERIGGEDRLVTRPGFLRLPVPVTDGVILTMPVTTAVLDARITDRLTGARFGGVMKANHLDQERGLSVEEIGILPEHSLLDAHYANLLGPILALPAGTVPGCRTPDVDLDGDGLEQFCDTDPNDDDRTVDLCIDGDGTMIADVPGVSECSEAIGPDGPRFVDGISVAFGFDTEPAEL
jgi:hypothetical protein